MNTTGKVSVVIATHERRDAVLATIEHLRRLASRPPVIVVDNGSSDGTAAAVRRSAPWAALVALPRNVGAAGRTIGVREARTPYVAFCDDDSWWAPDALLRARRHLDEHPSVGLIAARVLVGPEQREDPVSRAMAASPLPRDRGPATPVLGFLACGAVVRRDAFLGVGGFEPRFGIGGEEQLLAIDLAAAGWELVHLPEVVAHHHPGTVTRDRARRRRDQTRNAVWCAWLRRPARRALVLSLREARIAIGDRPALWGLADAIRHGAWVARERRAVEPWLERRLRLLEE